MLVTDLNREVQAAGGLYALTCRKIAEKRAGMTQNVAWSGPDVTRTKRGAGKVWFESKPITPEKPVKKIVPMSDCTSVEDDVIETHSDDPVELSLTPQGPVAGQDDIEDDGAEEEEIDMSSEFERGDGQSDATVTDGGECE